MKSFAAALRNLTLPYGSTGGTRIVLDGVTGAIKFYDATDALVIDQEASSSSIAVGEDQGVVLDGASGGLFIYAGTPAEGNLIGSWALEAGTDPYGNDFPSGISVVQGELTGVSLESATLVNAVLTSASLTGGSISGASIQGGTATELVLEATEEGGGVFVYESTTTTDTYAAAGESTWTAPADVTTAKVECWGAGGGGGAGTTSHGAGGAGGGEYAAEMSYSVTPGAEYTVIVGDGGTGGINSDPDGSDGGDSTFDGTGVVAHGGGGGGGSTSSYAGGTGGTGSTNTTHYPGGDGVGSGDTSGGGAGSSAGTGAAGDDGSGITGGTAPAGGGDGGNGSGSPPADGSDGSAPGGGGGGSTSTNADTSTTKDYYPVHTYSYYGSGVGGGLRSTDAAQFYQGSPNTSLSSYPGDQVSYCLFDYGTLHADISGAVVDQVKVTMTNLHSWYSGGMTVRLGYSTATSFGATIPGVGNNVNVQSFSIGNGATLTKDITSAFSGVLSSLTALMWGWTSTTSPTYYGYFQRSSVTPKLTVTYHTGGTSPTTGGDGADGKVAITYVSGTTLVGSWAPAAGTDRYGNAYPAGLKVNTLNVTGDSVFEGAVELENGLNAMSGSLSTETQQVLSGTSVPTTNASGQWTINTGLTTLRGFVAWNGDVGARPNMVIGNNRGNFPAASNGSVSGTCYWGSSGATINNTAVRIDWIAFGV